jgi:hypothetical protein
LWTHLTLTPQLPDQRSYLVECVAALPSSTLSNSRQNHQHQDDQQIPSGDGAAAITNQMSSLSITAEQAPARLPRVYFVDDHTRFVWLAKAPQSTTASAASASATESSSYGDLPMDTAPHDSNQTPALSHIQNQNQNPKPAAAADAFAAIGGLGAQIEVR